MPEKKFLIFLFCVKISHWIIGPLISNLPVRNNRYNNRLGVFCHLHKIKPKVDGCHLCKFKENGCYLCKFKEDGCHLCKFKYFFLNFITPPFNKFIQNNIIIFLFSIMTNYTVLALIHTFALEG